MVNLNGLTWDMQQRAKRLMADAPPELQSIFGSQSAIASGYRSPEQQAQAIASVAARNGLPMSERALTHGIPGMAAGVGKSKHQSGEAMDWNFAGMPQPAKDYLTSNAGRYGLQFPLPKTDSVHMEIDPKFYGPVQPVEDGMPQAPFQSPQQPAPQQPQQPPTQQSPSPMAVLQPQEDNGLVGVFRNAMENPLVMAGLGLMSSSAQGKDVGTGLINGMGLAREGDKFAQERKRQAALQQMLKGGQGFENVPPALLQLAQATGDVSPIAQHLVKGSGTDDIKEYEYAKARGFQGSLQDWMVNKRASQGEYAKQLVYGADAKGDIVPMQAGSRGDLIASKMPDGVKLQRDPIKIETATGTVLIDPTTRQQMGFVPKNVAEGARQGEVGKSQGTAQVDLPKVESSSKAIMDKIQAVEGDPALSQVTGIEAYSPFTLRSSSRDIEAKISQLGGSAFLQAFESLKGGGAITEVEGQKATQALARLSDLKQSDAGFKQSLRDFAQEVARLQELARTRAGNGIAPQAPQTTLPQGWSIQKVQ